ncbi:helix-turn-helix transcriptional regulator [Streptomyces microflavus]|uniref:helix-turn-helix transcriptional regulator n=1 Tax=Streptomyces microflavus TaxID=1919 RepID=UPI00381464CD
MPERTLDGGTLRDFRLLNRLSLAVFAERTGVRRNAAHNWETGKAKPSPERLPRIAAAVEADLDKIAPRSGPPTLADLRCDAGMTQQETTEYTRTRSPMAVRAAERGERPLADTLCEGLAAAYGVSVEQLLAAQKRSFGQAVPVIESATPAAAPASAKLAFLCHEVFQGTLPSDSWIAAEGNRKAGKPVLTEGLVEGLRRGTGGEASAEELEALALALGVPPVFFRTADPLIEHLVAAVRAIHSSGSPIAEEDQAELLGFIRDTVATTTGDQRG